MRRICLALAFLLAALVPSLPAWAQGAARLSISSLDASGFPTIALTLDAFDAQGAFISGLGASDITLLEDNQPAPVVSIVEQQPGVQFVAAINPGPAFALQDDQGVSRYDLVSQALQAWAAALTPPARDDLSLVAYDQAGALHLSDPNAWADGLASYRPDGRATSPSLESLALALQTASDVTPQPGMKRAVLFVTALLDPQDIPALQNLAALAAQMEVRVFVWVVSAAEDFASTPATALKDLALQTGGTYFLFSGVETFPDPEQYLAPLRHSYALTYASTVRTTGLHSLTAQAASGGVTITSAALSFELDVLPPNPILVSPPEQIVRQAPEDARFEPANLLPAGQALEIIIEFPDGLARPLASTRLYVDGQLAAENLAAPFDHFTWDLSAYSTSGQRLLQVEAVDSLGLSAVSMAVPVTITVLEPPGGLLPFLKRNSLWLTLGSVLLAGAALGGILTASRRSRGQSTAERKHTRRMERDPVTQPILQATGRPGHLPWMRRPKAPPAYLVRLKGDGQPATRPPLSLTGSELTFGSDPIQSSHVLEDESVSPLHARLRQVKEGRYLLLDQGSLAGTWVNLEPVPAEGRLLQHGDLVNLGRVSFRFMLRKPPDATRPRLLPVPGGKKEKPEAGGG
ncbi:MAG: FHA domain-containing protein [Chloroflexi bacterium]|nr:FHA domain-containing protein [Chloroflexota bacterium]